MVAQQAPTGHARSMDRAIARPTERLRPTVVGYWLVSDSLGTLFLCGLAWFVALPLLAEHWSQWSESHANVLLGMIAGALLLTVLVPPLSYARWRYGFADNLLLLRHGILFVEERAVPVQRMQHVDLLRGPIERLFGLATLVVFTAGNEGSSFRLPGLAAATAQELRDRIVQARGDGRL